MIKGSSKSIQAEKPFASKYFILDTSTEKDFDDVTKLAVRMFGASLCFIFLPVAEQKWFNTQQLASSKMDDDIISVITLADDSDDTVIIEDIRKDERFTESNHSYFLFYACKDYLCIADNNHRQFSNEEENSLEILAGIVNKLLADRKNAETTKSNTLFQQSVQLLSETGKIAKLGGWSVDLITNKIEWTAATNEIHEVPAGYIPTIEDGLDFYKPGKSRNLIKQLVKDALANGNPYEAELEIITAKGNSRWIRTKGEVEMKEGTPVRFYGIIQDIHAEKIKDIKLAQNELQFRETFNHATIGMAIVSLTGQWIKVNKSLCKILGYNKEELLNTTFQQITYPEDLQSDLEKLNALIRNEISNYQVEKRYIHKNGSIVCVILSVSLVKSINNKPLHFVSQVLDITLRKKTEEILKEERKLLATVINNLPVNIFIKDTQHRKIMLNDKEAEYLGVTNKEDVLGKTDYDFYPKETADISFEEDKNVLEKGLSILYMETENIKTGNSPHWFLTSKIPLKNDVGEITGLLGICHDITERKNSERINQELVDVTTEQNNRLINFAHIVSHNLKSYAINFSLLLNLINDEPDEKERAGMLKMLNQASDNLIKTIDHLNEVVIINTSASKKKISVNLYHILERIRSTLNAELLATNVELYNNIDKEINVDAVPAYMDSILLNFITNAIKYRRQGDVSFVELTTIIQDKYVVLIIEDNGLGINMARNKDKLFGMYKTFHNNTDARGIGLFITKNQVIAMGGKIEVESEVGKGTTFKIYFLRSAI